MKLVRELDPDALQRQTSMLRILSMGVVVIGVPFIAQYAWLGVTWMAGLLAAVVVCTLVTFALTRRSQPLSGSLVILGLLFVLLVSSNVVSGGFYNPNFAWLYVLPMMGALVVDSRVGWVLTGAVLVTTLVFWALPELGMPLSDQIPEGLRAGQALANRLSAVVGIGIVLAALDARDRRRARAILMARDQAEAASTAKSRFLAVMSHELRTPLNAVLGYSELLEERSAIQDDPGAVADLQRIQTSAQRLTKLIGDILDVTHLESGEVELRTEPVEVARIVAETTAEARMALLEAGNTLYSEVEPGLVCHTDRRRVRQILEALLDNAARFCTDGEVVVRAKRTNQAVIIEVQDSGIGMSAAALETLFSPFTQVHGRDHAEVGGIGLSLALSKLLAQHMGGDLSAVSEPDVGTTFTLTLESST